MKKTAAQIKKFHYTYYYDLMNPVGKWEGKTNMHPEQAHKHGGVWLYSATYKTGDKYGYRKISPIWIPYHRIVCAK